MNIKQVPTPDFTKGRKSYEFIVMHWSVTSNIAQVDSEVLNPSREMSYHYAIENGEVHQYVNEANTAWHAGVFDINQRSIGVCIVAGPNNPYSDQDYATASELIGQILSRHPGMQLKGHRDFKATECPGNLDFNRLKGEQMFPEDKKDAIQFAGDTKVYAWLPDPSWAAKLLGADWGKYVRAIQPQIKEVQVPGPERVVTNTVYVDRPVEVPVNITTDEEKAAFIAEYAKDHPPVVETKIEYKDGELTLGQALSFIWNIVKNIKLNKEEE